MKQRLFAIAFLIGSTGAFAQVSPFTGIAPSGPLADGSYRMIMSGHLHGASHDRSGFPAATILANIDRINVLNADLFISTGDLFLDPEADHERYQRSLFSRLNMPLFNAPGNHDKGAYYEEHFGRGHGVITMGSDRIVLLDTEIGDGSLNDEQLALLEDQLRSGPARIFIISHRPIWAEDDDRYGPLFEGNTRSFLGNNFGKKVYPLIEKLAERSQVFWLSGSMAGGAPSSIFFQPHAPNITFIQTAIRNEPRDALLIADVSAEGISWNAISLTGKEVLAPEEYDAEWWWQHRDKKGSFNWRLLPYLIKSTISRAEFWYGALAGIVLLIGMRWVLRRWL